MLINHFLESFNDNINHLLYIYNYSEILHYFPEKYLFLQNTDMSMHQLCFDIKRVPILFDWLEEVKDSTKK